MTSTPLFVILAGGEGKRFAPFVTNKTMFPFLGKPLLQHQLEQLRHVGVTEVLVATNEDNHDWLNSFRLPGLTIRTHLQPEPLGMADALLNLENEIGDQPIVVMNAVDVVNDTMFSALLAEIEKNPYGLITGMRVSSYFPGGYIKKEGERAVAVIEKPPKGQEPSDLVNLVFHYFSRPQEFLHTLKNLNDPSADDIYEQALSQLMSDHEFGVVTYEGYWHKLKFPHFVLGMTELFLKERLQPYISPTASIDKSAVIKGTVFIDDGAIIDAGAVISGPVYIGKNTRVGTHTLIRQSVVEDNAVIGFGTEVARSYIGPKCMLHHNFIGDSVLEGDVNPSYGTTTANWRLDKQAIAVKTYNTAIETDRDKLGAIIAQGAFLGVNCTILPGITIGANARVYPNTTVHQSVPADATLKSYQQQEIVS